VNLYTYIYTHICTYSYIRLYLCICMCSCKLVYIFGELSLCDRLCVCLCGGCVPVCVPVVYLRWSGIDFTGAVWELLCTAGAPPSIVVTCEGWFFVWSFVVLFSSGFVWCCFCHVCVCVTCVPFHRCWGRT